MVVHPQLLQSDRYWHQSLATMALLAAVLWIGSLDRRDSSAMAVGVATPELAAPLSSFEPSAQTLQPKIIVVKDRALMMRIYSGVDK